MHIIIEKGIGKGSIHHLHDGVNTLGRDVTNRIRLSDPKISRHHCKIRKIGLSLFLSDLGTKNGTLVNGKVVTEREVELGDSIALGATILKVVEDSFQPGDVVEQPGAFSFFRVISTALSGGRRNRTAQKSCQVPRKSRLLIWKPHPVVDPTESGEKAVVTTDHDLKS